MEPPICGPYQELEATRPRIWTVLRATATSRSARTRLTLTSYVPGRWELPCARIRYATEGVMNTKRAMTM